MTFSPYQTFLVLFAPPPSLPLLYSSLFPLPITDTSLPQCPLHVICLYNYAFIHTCKNNQRNSINLKGRCMGGVGGSTEKRKVM